MRNGDAAPPGRGLDTAILGRDRADRQAAATGRIIETVVSPFHCLYQDAMEFHTQSHLRLPRSEAEASRLARAALILYLDAAEALVHQAAAELARPELAALLADPERPTSAAMAWKLLPAIVCDGPTPGFDPDSPPWPQFTELLTLRAAWLFPGPAASRRAYSLWSPAQASFEPLETHQVPPGVAIPADRLSLPRTGLPLDPYALRPRHLDTARSVLDRAIEALDRRLGGALTRDGRHRREPVRVIHPAPEGA